MLAHKFGILCYTSRSWLFHSRPLANLFQRKSISSKWTHPEAYSCRIFLYLNCCRHVVPLIFDALPVSYLCLQWWTCCSFRFLVSLAVCLRVNLARLSHSKEYQPGLCKKVRFVVGLLVLTSRYRKVWLEIIDYINTLVFMWPCGHVSPCQPLDKGSGGAWP